MQCISNCDDKFKIKIALIYWALEGQSYKTSVLEGNYKIREAPIRNYITSFMVGPSVMKF